MRSLVFEGNTWEACEAMRERDKQLHKALRKSLTAMLRSDDPSIYRFAIGGHYDQF